MEEIRKLWNSLSIRERLQVIASSAAGCAILFSAFIAVRLLAGVFA